jgi:hypothetical protein
MMIAFRTAPRRRAVSLVGGVAGIVLAACAAPIGGSAQPLPGNGTATASASLTTVSASPTTSRGSSPATSRSQAATTTRSTAATSSRPPATTASRTTAAVDDELVLGPTGWKDLILDMNEGSAAALGMFTSTPPAGDGCQEWKAVLAAPIESVIVSPTFGVVAIQPRADAGMSTPEGMKIGWTAQQVAAKYPDFSVDEADSPNGTLVQVPDDPFAFYRLTFADGKLANFMLESIFQDCYG